VNPLDVLLEIETLEGAEIPPPLPPFTLNVLCKFTRDIILFIHLKKKL
jgi:hypothetical protein